MLKEMIYASIGLATITREKAEEVISELVKKGEMTQEEGKDVLGTLMKKAKEENEKLKQKIKEQVDSAVASLDTVTRTEFDEAIKRISELEKELAQIKEEMESQKKNK